MDASRYFDAMHNAMSTQHVGAQLLLTVRLQDTCGNDAYLEVKQLPGEQSALVCYSTMGRRCLNFQLFRKGWQLGVRRFVTEMWDTGKPEWKEDICFAHDKMSEILDTME